VHLSLSQTDIDCCEIARLKTWVDGVTRDSFTLHVGSWDGSKVWRVSGLLFSSLSSYLTQSLFAFFFFMGLKLNIIMLNQNSELACVSFEKSTSGYRRFGFLVLQSQNLFVFSML
jgi:hypothetical protein